MATPRTRRLQGLTERQQIALLMELTKADEGSDASVSPPPAKADDDSKPAPSPSPRPPPPTIEPSSHELTERQQIAHLLEMTAKSPPAPALASSSSPSSSLSSSLAPPGCSDASIVTSSEDGPRCWFVRPRPPPAGSVVWIHSYPGPAWYRAVVKRVVQSKGRQGKGRLIATYDCDGSIDHLNWPDDDVRLECCGETDYAPAAAAGHVSDDLGGEARCSLAGAVRVILPSSAAITKTAEVAGVAGAAGAAEVGAPFVSLGADVDQLCARATAAVDGFSFAGVSGREEHAASHGLLRQYKRIGDILLSGLRGRGVLHHLTWKKENTTLVVYRKREKKPAVPAAAAGDDAGKGGSTGESSRSDEAGDGDSESESDTEEDRDARDEREVVGGITFRLLVCGSSIVADVLTLGVARIPSVRGVGLGTRLVNIVKQVAVAEAARMSMQEVEQRTVAAAAAVAKQEAAAAPGIGDEENQPPSSAEVVAEGVLAAAAAGIPSVDTGRPKEAAVPRTTKITHCYIATEAETMAEVRTCGWVGGWVDGWVGIRFCRCTRCCCLHLPRASMVVLTDMRDSSNPFAPPTFLSANDSPPPHTHTHTLHTLQATMFWRKQGLLAGPDADHCFAHLLQAEAVRDYWHVVHMLQRLPLASPEELLEMGRVSAAAAAAAAVRKSGGRSRAALRNKKPRDTNSKEGERGVGGPGKRKGSAQSIESPTASVDQGAVAVAVSLALQMLSESGVLLAPRASVRSQKAAAASAAVQNEDGEAGGSGLEAAFGALSLDAKSDSKSSS